MSIGSSLNRRRAVIFAFAARFFCAFYLLVAGVGGATLGPSLSKDGECAGLRAAESTPLSQDAPSAPDRLRHGPCCVLCQSNSVDLVDRLGSTLRIAPPDGGLPSRGPVFFANALPKAPELSPSAPRGPPILFI